MQELLEYIIHNIVGEAVEFEIKQSESETGMEFEVHLPEEYCGQLIGRGGQNIKSIRDVVNMIARRENRRIFIKVKNT